MYFGPCCALSSSQPAMEYAQYRKLLQPSTWLTINSTLVAAGLPHLKYITARSVMAPLVTVPNCTVHPSLASAQCTASQGFDRLRLTVLSNLSVTSATVMLGSDLSAPPSSRRQQQSCSLVSSTGPGGCLIGSCDIHIASRIANETIIVTDIQYANATLLTTDCVGSSIGVSAQISYGNEPTNTTVTVNNESTDFTPFLASGIAIFVAGAALAWMIAIVLFVRFRFIYNRAVRDRVPQLEELSWLARTKAEMLVRLGVHREARERIEFRLDRCASGFFVAGFVTAVGASVLVLVYSTSLSLDSNFSVLYEEYSDSQCDQSAVSYMPRRLFAVPAGSSGCERMQAVGESVSVTYATGKCYGEDGSYRATFKMAPAKTMCRLNDPQTFASGSCVPIKLLDPFTDRNVFVKLTCSDSQIINNRVGLIQSLTGRVDVFVDGELAAPNARLLPKERSHPSHPFVLPYIAGIALQESTSFIEGVLVSQALPDTFDNDYNPLRLVMQQGHCTFSSDHLCMQGAETALADQMAELPTSDDLFPSIPDVPIGQLFGGFGTMEPSSWAVAGPSAHRYYGIAGTSFDMGRRFSTNGGAGGYPTDEDGYAVSLWLRADYNTLGFAYAVTDAFENIDTRQVYPVERLARIIASGEGGRSWFDTTYRVYQSLYVNGPGRSLTFACASPNNEGRTAQLEFDLQDIGASYIFNGHWHHIAITFLVENNRVRAKLIVDGKTSDVKVGWSACVDDLPEPISVVPSNNKPTSINSADISFQPKSAPAKVFDHQTDFLAEYTTCVLTQAVQPSTLICYQLKLRCYVTQTPSLGPAR